MNPILIKPNFENDLLEMIRWEYEYAEIRFPKNLSLHNRLVDYMTINHKIIPKFKREVLFSQVIKEKIEANPKGEFVLEIAEKLRNGRDVNYHQSKKIFQASFFDHLLNHWNIRHFHLSNQKSGKSKFYSRTNDLLFAFIDNRSAFFIDIGDHKSNFADQHFLEILHDEFPESICNYVQHEDVMPMGKDLTNEERFKLWKSGTASLMVRIKNKIYQSPGGGGTTSGHSIQAVMEANRMLQWISVLEEQINDFFNEIVYDYKLDQPEVEFAIDHHQGNVWLVERKEKNLFFPFPKIFDAKALQKLKDAKFTE